MLHRVRVRLRFGVEGAGLTGGAGGGGGGEGVKQYCCLKNKTKTVTPRRFPRLLLSLGFWLLLAAVNRVAFCFACLLAQ